MSRERSSLTSALVNIGAALAGALGVSAVIRALAGSEHTTPSQSITSQQMKGRSVGTGDGARGAVKRDAAPAHPAAHPRVELRPGWHVPEHLELPEPTYWPAVLAFGITLFAWGILTSYIMIGVGLLVFAVALAGWIGDLRHGH